MGNLEPKNGCIASAMQIVGNRWTALILRDLADGPKRFSELQKSVGSINPRTLSQRLEDLTAHDIIVKDGSGYCNYELTTKGKDLIPVVQQMAAWGEKYYSSALCD